jgi:hypothetical protein
MRWRSASLTACSCALLLTGCGGGSERTQQPRKLPADVAAKLAERADTVARLAAANERCAARDAARRLQADAIAAVQSRRVPQAFREPLLSAANELADRLSACAPPVEQEHGKGRGKGDRRGRGHGKHKGEGD